MFLIRLLRWLMSLPFLWSGRLAATLNFPVSAALLRIAWVVGGSGRVARMALGELFKRAGAEIAMAQGELWLTKRLTPEVAAFVGLLAIQCERTDRARELLALAHECGDDPEGMIDILELGLAERNEDPSVSLELAQRWESRRDLAPTASKFVHSRLLWDDLHQGRLDEAARRVKHLLAVADDVLPAAIMWALCTRQGRRADANRYLRHAGPAKPVEVLAGQCMAGFAVGLRAEAEEMLDQLDSMDAAAADRVRLLTAGRGER